MRARKGAARRQAKKKTLKAAKGFWGGRRRIYRVAAEALLRAGAYAYRDRRNRKRDFRRLWITRITAACRQRKIRYSEFMHGIKLAEVELDRKSLSELAIHDPAAFDQLVETAREVLTAQPAGAS